MLKKNIIALALIFALVALAGGLWLKFAPDFGVKRDAAAYDEIAWNLAQRQGFNWNNYTAGTEAPGYPYFLAIIYFILGHNYTIVKAVQLLLLALIGVFVFMTAKRLSMKYIYSLLAGLLVVVWPYFLLYANLILTEMLFSLILIITVYLLLLFQKKPSYLKAVILGVMLGAGALTRPVALLLPVWLFFGLLLFFDKFRQPKSFLKLLVLIAAFVITLTPWTIRNYIEFNEFLPVKSGFTSITQKAFVELDYESLDAEAKAPGEATFRDVAVAKVKNIYLFWKPGAGGRQAEALVDKYPKANYLIWIYQIGFLLILAFAFLSWRFLKSKKILLLWLVIAYFWAVHTVLYPYPRYTLPIIPIVIVLCFFTVHSLLLGLTKQLKQ